MTTTETPRQPKPAKGWTPCEGTCETTGKIAVEVEGQDWDAIEAGAVEARHDLVDCDDCDGVGWHRPMTQAELDASERAYRAAKTQRELDHLANYHSDGEGVGDGCFWAYCRVVRGTA